MAIILLKTQGEEPLASVIIALSVIIDLIEILF